MGPDLASLGNYLVREPVQTIQEGEKSKEEEEKERYKLLEPFRLFKLNHEIEKGLI